MSILSLDVLDTSWLITIDAEAAQNFGLMKEQLVMLIDLISMMTNPSGKGTIMSAYNILINCVVFDPDAAHISKILWRG